MIQEDAHIYGDWTLDSSNFDKYLPEKGMKIYGASKTRHAQMWIDLKSEGYDIISTWIYEAGKGESSDLRDLICRCIREASTCDWLILYVEPGDMLKCALVEVGAALAHDKQVIILGECESVNSETIFAHPNVWKCTGGIYEALNHIRQQSKS